jgi:FkbM family methyltransferase
MPSFISYSANNEDVILNRMFGSRKSGFYIDVGAGHPLYKNDTRALYDRGWRGINIEPNMTLYRELVAQRPCDRNINTVVSDTPGLLVYHEVVGTGLSTCDPEEAERAAAKGFEVVHHEVEAMTLQQILDAAESPEIDLLKVDVAGFELKVLFSNDWGRFRPKVVLVEATYPETPCRRPDVIAPFLAEQGYQRAYFDGLNDYYIEGTFHPAPEVFDRPPNVFDNFRTFAYSMLLHERERLAGQLRLVTHTAQALATEIENARAELRAMHERSRILSTLQQKLDATGAGLTL